MEGISSRWDRRTIRLPHWPSNQKDDVAVFGQHFVGRHELEWLCQCLSYQQAVEWVVVMEFERGHPRRMGCLHRKLQKPARVDCLGQFMRVSVNLAQAG